MAQKRTPKRLTNNELAAAIASLHEAMLFGFDRVDRRFEGLEAEVAGLAGLAGRIDSLEHSMNKRFDRVDLRFDVIEGRLTALGTARS